MLKLWKPLAGLMLLGMVSMAQAEVYELRTYTAVPGKMENLKARFRDHALPGFQRHGLKVLGTLMTPMEDKDGKGNVIIYVLVHESRESATKNWAEFQADPAWVKGRTESVKDGPITTSVVSVFLDKLDLSAMAK